MPRYPIQIISMFVFLVAIVVGIRVLRKNVISKYCTLFLLGWVVHKFIFTIVLTIRILYYWGEPPADYSVLVWANIIQLHGGLAAISTFTTMRKVLKGLRRG